jgi:hypothetical protein
MRGSDMAFLVEAWKHRVVGDAGYNGNICFEKRRNRGGRLPTLYAVDPLHQFPTVSVLLYCTS